MITDESLMPFGMHKGKKLANVPPEYLIWISENFKINSDLKKYIKENMDVLKTEVERKNKSI
jgi:uncharacterized protein (DUF3820 family)